MSLLNLDGPHRPFSLATEADLRGVSVSSSGGVKVCGELIPRSDKPIDDVFVVKAISKERATPESVQAWLDGLSPGDSASISFLRFRKVRGKFVPTSETQEVTIDSNAELARKHTRSKIDPVDGSNEVTNLNATWQMSLITRKEKSGTVRLFLKARCVHERRLGVNEIQVAMSGKSESLPVEEREAVRDISDRGYFTEDVFVDISDRFSLHLLLANDPAPLTIRFNGEKERKDNQLSGEDFAPLRDVLLVHYADRFGK